MRRGVVLLFVLGVLVMLAVMALVFAAFVQAATTASSNRLLAVRAELLANSGLERALAELRDAVALYPYDDLTLPWAFADNNKNPLHGKSLQDLLREANEPDMLKANIPVFVKGALGGLYCLNGDQFAVRVLDCASQINLNGGQDPKIIARMLDVLGWALSKRFGINPFSELRYIDPQDGKLKTGGEAVMAFRATLLDERFSTKSQLRELFVQAAPTNVADPNAWADERYRIVRDFISTHGWMDDKAIVGSEDTTPTGFTTFKFEQHAPININTAPKEVLVAALAGLAGRFRYPYVHEYTSQKIWQDAGNLVTPIKEEEATKYEVGLIFVYIPPITVEQAERIADKIISWRKKRPFKSWADWEYFVRTQLNAHDSGMFPQPNQAYVPDKAKVAGSTVSVNRTNVVNHPKWRNYFEDCWFRAVKEILLANFNPNARPHFYNTDAGARLLVAKADLFFPEKVAGGTYRQLVFSPAPGGTYKANAALTKACSTEWCFNSMGYFELTCVGRVLSERARRRKRVVEAEAQVRAVVKLGDRVCHTTQADFESAPPQFKQDIVTYPEHMERLEKSDSGGASTAIGFLTLKHYQDRWYGLQGDTPLFEQKFDDDFAADKATWQEEMNGPNPTLYGFCDNLNPNGLVYDNSTDLFPDGFYSSIIRDSKIRILRYQAAIAPSTIKSLNNDPERYWTAALQSNQNGDFNGPCNVHPYKGAIEFWFKPDFALSSPVMSGFCCWTHRVDRVWPPDGSGGGKKRTYHGGTQFYFLKTETGALRISMFYYELFYIKDGGTYKIVPDVKFSGQDPDAWRWWPPYPKNRKLWEPDPGKPLPEEPNAHCKAARIDFIVPYQTLVSNGIDWQPGEWHHFVVTWNHESADVNNAIRLFIDGQRIPAIYLQKFPPPGTPATDWSDAVITNTVNPTDAFFLGCVWRRQRYRSVGLFKFERRDDVIRIPLNGTIDNVYVYSNPNRNFKQVPSRFITAGAYINTMEIIYPPGVRSIRIRGVNTYAYAPFKLGGKDAWGVDPATGGVKTCTAIYAKGEVPGVSVKLMFENGSPVKFGEPITSKTGYLRIKYLVNLDAIKPTSRTGGGPLGQCCIASPVLDSVAVDYVYDKAQVLVYEGGY